MNQVPTAVIGVGRLGREHARLLGSLPGSKLVGVHDILVDRGKEVARSVGTRHWSELTPLLERARAVVVAVPTVDHHPVARSALEAGAHVLVEKPLTSTLEQADDLIATAEERGVRLAVGHVERFNPAVRSCMPHIDSPRFIESLRLAPFQPRGTDVTVILDLMIHDIDLVLGLARSQLASVHAVGTPVLTDSVDIANARLVFEDGSVAEITASRVSEELNRTLRIFQPSGYLRLDLARGEGEFLRRKGASSSGGRPPAGLEDIVQRIPLQGDGAEPLRLELEAFLDAVRGEDSRVVPARDGRAALEIAFRITEQIERFTDVTLETA